MVAPTPTWPASSRRTPSQRSEERPDLGPGVRKQSAPGASRHRVEPARQGIMLAMGSMRRRVVAAMLAVLVVAAGCGNTSDSWIVQGHGPASVCDSFRARAADRLAAVTGSGPRVVVIGDSWAVGRGLVGHQRPWPAQLPGEVHVSGFPGSGYSEQDMARCGRVSLADRAPNALREGADLVVVEGGLNDVGRSRASIVSGFHRLMASLRGHDVVIIGPPRAPKRGDRVVRIDRLLRRLSRRAGVPYVSTLDIRLPYLHDGLHPTAAGHVTFGRIVARRIAKVTSALPPG